MNSVFKKCTMCEKEWASRKEFLEDKKLQLNGYTADFEKLDFGLFYFTHTEKDCGSTITLYASNFTDLYTGEHFKEKNFGKETCPGYCLDKDELRTCDAVCECAFVREVIQIVKSYE